MLRDKYQEYAMELMHWLKYIKVDQLFTLIHLRFGITAVETERSIRQLCYGHKLQFDYSNEGHIRLPYAKYEPQSIQAIDVVLDVCGRSSPEIAKGELHCKLNFFIQDKRGYLDFKIVFVPLGEEQLISAKMIAQTKGYVCTCLFIIEHEHQIPLLATNNTAYYILTQENGKLVFLKGQ